jgi:hypothetical protein
MKTYENVTIKILLLPKQDCLCLDGSIDNSNDDVGNMPDFA